MLQGGERINEPKCARGKHEPGMSTEDVSAVVWLMDFDGPTSLPEELRFNVLTRNPRTWKKLNADSSQWVEKSLNGSFFREDWPAL